MSSEAHTRHGATTETPVSPGELQPGDVLLHNDDSPAARLIRLLDGTEVHHASLVLPSARVAESMLKSGVVERGLGESVEPRRWVLVRRFRPRRPASLEPVVERARDLVREGHRYGYEQIVVLAVLCVTRRAPMTPRFVPMVTYILETAALQLATCLEVQNLTLRPWVCSGFVHHCFASAPPPGAYALEVRRPPGRRGAPVETDSLLSRAMRWTGAATARRGPQANRTAERTLPSEGDLGPWVTPYLDEVHTTDDDAGGQGADGADLRGALLRFAEAVTRATEQPQARPSRPRGGEPSPTQALAGLARVAAQLVTPGDLLRSPSLTSLGRLAGR